MADQFANFMGLDMRSLLGGYRPPTVFEQSFRCYSFAMCGRENLENGDKILLPPSALEALSQMHVQYPMMFKLSNPKTQRKTHCGVLEFSAPEGRCYISHWMMQNLVLAEGELVVLRNLQLPKATFARFRPHSKDFLDITDHKAVLERQLSRFSALTKGDVVCFRYADRNHYMDVLELKPADAVTIIETDCAVDFAPPVDYVEPIYKPAAPPVASVSAGIGGRGGTAGLGTLESPFMLDDDDAPRTGSGAPPFYPAGGAPPAGEGYLKRVRALGSSPHVGSAAAASPIGGVSAAGAAPPPLSLAGGSPMVGAAAATAAGGSSVTPFAGTGRRLADSGGVSESKGGGITSPSLSPSLTPAAGGVVLMPGPGASSRPQRTLNRFEQARAAKAFQGQGKSLLE